MFYRATSKDTDGENHENCIHGPGPETHALGAFKFRGPDYELDPESMAVEQIPVCLFPKHKGFLHELVREWVVH